MHVENYSFFLSVDTCHSHAYHVISHAIYIFFFVTSIDVSKKLCDILLSQVSDNVVIQYFILNN